MIRRKQAIIIVTVLLLVTAGLILFLSSKDATRSMDDSIRFDRILAMIFVDGFDEMSPEQQYLAAVQFDEVVRHFAHFMEFAVLGVLLAILTRLIRRRGWVAFAIGTAYGVIDEVMQLFVEGRDCQLQDLCFDAAGVLMGVVIVWVIGRVRKQRAQG